MKPYKQELVEELTKLDEKAKAYGAEDIRASIAQVKEYMNLPQGNDNARLAIVDFREKLGARIRERKSEKRLRSPQKPQNEVFVPFQLDFEIA